MRCEHRAPELLAGRAAQPPGEREPLVPAEVGGVAAREGSQPELADAGDRAAVLDPHHRARLPRGDHEVVGGVQRPDAGQAVELGADTGVLRRAEGDGLGVEHPLGVGLDALDRLPHRVGRSGDGDAEVDGHTHRATSRSSAAARSGGTVLTRMPVACSKPATTVSRGVISTYQWYGPAPGGAVCTTRL